MAYDYDPMEEVEDDLANMEQELGESVVVEYGTPLSVRTDVLPTAMVVRTDLNGILFDVTIPHDSFDVLDLTIAAFPATFKQILEVAREDDDDE